MSQVSQAHRRNLAQAPAADRPVPCSSAQRRLWFLQQLAPASAAAYNVTAAFRVHGALDREALAAAMADLMARQDALRTRIVERDGEPWQEVLEAPEPPLRVLPPPAETDPKQLGDVVRAELDRVFDAAQAPMWQIALIPVGAQEHLLALSASHLICDGWSLGLLLDELAEHYAAHCAGRRFEPAPLPVRYADFAADQRARRDDPAVAAELDRWADELAGLPATAPLPDLSRPPIQRFRGARIRFPVPPDLTGAVADTARRLGATPSVCHLAAYLVLLARSTGNGDVVIGMPVAGRDRLELESVIGFFAGTAPVRCGLTGNETAEEVVALARAATQRALRHQHLPFEELVERLQPTRDTSVNPVFQSFFAYQNTPVRGLRLPGLSVEPFPVAYATSKFDLMLELVETGDGAVRCDIEYNRDLYLPETADRFAGQYLRTLEWVTNQDGQTVRRFPLATEQERRRWQSRNRTAVHFDGPQTLDALLAAQASRTPNALCLIDDTGTLDYRQLRERTVQLADLLQARGAGPDQLVAVCLPRSSAQVVALVGTVTAGAAYLPLDPSHPVSRLRAITDQARPRVLVTTPELAGAGLVDDGTPVVVLDEQLTALDGRPTNWDRPGPHPDHLAYAIFTSGSTGAPKGVMVSHRAIVNRLAWMQSQYPLHPEDRVLQKTPSTFDVSVWEYFWPLITGAQLVVAAPDAHRDPVAIAATIAAHRVSVLHFVPTMLAEFLAADLPPLPSLRRVFSSGEALDVTLAQRLRDRFPTIGLHNLYGPTEAAVDVTYHDCAEPEGRATVPIGRPVANTTVHVRDADGEPVPTGVPGELYLGGVQLARGYLGRPDLTAAAFVPDPYGPPGARLYRTGDLVRWRDDGELEYLGRIDHQVKIRGQRIELGEVETAMRRHREVADAVAAVCDLPNRGPTLVGYATLKPAPDLAGDDSIGYWHEVWEHVYDTPRPVTGPDFAGWVSSYTGQPVPHEQMERFVAATVERIRTLGGRRLLEIGVGSGLLLHRLAPHLEEYWATDLSATAIQTLTEQVASDPALAARVKLWHREAADLDDLPAGRFDGVILNSVVQYFPSTDYLRLVLRRALRLVRDGGYVFLGDLRSARLLPAQHASVQAVRAVAGVTAGELAARIRDEVAHERELTVEPGFLVDAVADCGPVQVGHAVRAEADDTEMSRFRYDAVIRKGGAPPPSPRIETVPPEVDLPTLVARLDRAEPLPLLLQAVPNIRTAEAVSLLAASQADPARPVAELRAEVASATGVEPNRLRAAAATRALVAAVGWSSTGPPGTVDVLVCATTGVGSKPATDAEFLPVVVADRVGATDPRRAHRRRRVEQDLRAMLAEQLPDSMAPSYLVLLDTFPVTSSGKVDRRRLPAPRVRGSGDQGSHQPPVTDTERVVAQVWSDLTRVDRVGRQDNFFTLGGDSILAVQAVSRLRERGLTVPLRVFFEEATVQQVAAAAQPLHRADPEETLMPLTAAQRELVTPAGRRAGPLVLRAPAAADLPPARLERAWRRLLRRQPGLRLRFHDQDGQTRQRIGPPADPQGPAAGPAAVAPAADVDALTGPAARLTTVDNADGGTDLVLTVDRLVATPQVLPKLGAELDALLADADAAGGPDREQAEQALRQRLAALAPPGDHWPAAATPPPAPPHRAAAAHRNRATATPLGPSVRRTPSPELRHRLTAALTRHGCTLADVLVAALAGVRPGGEDPAEPLVQLERADPAWPTWLIGPDRSAITVHLAAPPRSGQLLRSVKTQLRRPGPTPSPAPPRVLLVLTQSPAAGGGSRWKLDTPQRPDELLETYDVLVSVEMDSDLAVSVRCRPAETGTTADELTNRYMAELAALADLVAHGDEPLYVAEDFPVASLDAAGLAWLGRHRPGLADVYPLTPFQQHAVAQLADRPQDGLYTISTVFTLTGTGFDPAAFRRTWQVLMDRHAGLRTSFADLPGAGWYQLVHTAPPLPIDEQDLSSLPAAEREDRVRELAVAARRHRFDLATAPQWRMTILHLGDDDYRVVCLLSYALQDGWSFAVLQEEWFALYEAFRRGQPPPTLPTPRPMRDHVAWVLRQDVDAARAYWREALRELPHATGVRATAPDRPAEEPAVGEGIGAGPAADAATVALDPRLRYHATMVRLTRLQDHRMQAFARRHRLTVFTLLAASWALALARATGSDTVAFGTVSAGRSPEVPGSERIFGPLNNILPVVWPVPSMPGLTERLEWLHDLQHRHVAVRAHDYAALPDLATWTGADRVDPLVDNFLVFENFPRRAGLDDELRAWGPDGGETQTEHALRLLIWPSQPLTIHASYYRDVLSHHTVEALLRGLVDGLAELVAPDGSGT